MNGLPLDPDQVQELFEKLRRAEANPADEVLAAEVATELQPLLEAGVTQARQRTGPFEEARSNRGFDVVVGLFILFAEHGPRFIRPYALRLLNEPSRHCRWLAARTIGLAGLTVEADARETLLGLLGDEALPIRAEAVRALAHTEAQQGRRAVEDLVRSVEVATVNQMCSLLGRTHPMPGVVYSVILDLLPPDVMSPAYGELLTLVGQVRAKEAVPQLERFAEQREVEAKLPALAALYRVTRRKAVRRRFWRELETALTSVLALTESKRWEWKGDTEVERLDLTPDGRLIETVEATLQDAAGFPEPPDTLLAKCLEALTAAPALLRIETAQFLRRTPAVNAVIAEGLVEAFAFGMNEHAAGHTVNTAEVVITLYRRYRDEARKLQFLITQCCNQLETMDGFDPDSGSFTDLRRIEARLRRELRDRE